MAHLAWQSGYSRCMAKIAVEYLITSSRSESICTTVSTFENLLQAVDGLSILNGKIKFQSKEFDYKIKMGNSGDQDRIFFDIRIEAGSEKSIDQLVALSKKIRTVANKITSTPPQTLWDDVTFFYSKQAYPLIHEIENLMRKLITKFMIVNTGLGWHEKNVPKEVQASIKAKEKSVDYLHNVDFIQLTTFLFQNYGPGVTKPLIDKIKKASDLEGISIDDLKSIIPTSNWDRYFAPLMSCDGDYLKSKWDRLYELRCIVAHNKTFGFTEYSHVEALFNELKPILEESIEKLESISLTEEDKDVVAERVASGDKDSTRIFLDTFNGVISKMMEKLADKMEDGPDKQKILERRFNPRSIIDKSAEEGIMSDREIKRMRKFFYARNSIVHSTGLSIDSEVMDKYISQLNNIKNNLVLGDQQDLIEEGETQAGEIAALIR